MVCDGRNQNFRYRTFQWRKQIVDIGECPQKGRPAVPQTNSKSGVVRLRLGNGEFCLVNPVFDFIITIIIIITIMIITILLLLIMIIITTTTIIIIIITIIMIITILLLLLLLLLLLIIIIITTTTPIIIIVTNRYFMRKPQSRSSGFHGVPQKIMNIIYIFGANARSHRK